MAKSKIPNLQKYGIPFYAAAWAPYKEISSKLISKADDNDDRPSGESSSVGDGISSQNSAQHFVVLAGGGGEGHNGIPNAVVLSLFDFASNSLSPPVAKLGFGSDLPYRMVVHPGGDGVICAFPNSCKFYKWEEVKDCGTNELGLNLRQLQDKGQQLALTFNSEGSVLAVGGEDGNLRVFKWPSMEIILDEAEAHTSVKDLCFSPDGKFLVSLGSRGPGRVWDMSSTTVVASLSKENDEVFASCRFSQNSEKNQVLFIAAITGKGGSILTWNTSSWKRMSSKHVVKEPASSFDVSPDGKHLAIGTIQGDVLLVNSTDMRVQMMVRKAHLGIVTALRFSHDSRALVSASMDSSARVTLVKDKKSGGLSWLIITLIIILAIAVYILKNEGLIPPVA
ncbi:hypothetical protein K2173_002190 [Erythroxylum novogranatense]|uniref:SEC12-like protein 2 n=1 Tax=Erythroxylum novogranatense TaxID=1862640 RepID=A0AAV8TQT9_9ROSI|nr:hypothetical protein K2173_002190 [Erythroxylum novogranatense]